MADGEVILMEPAFIFPNADRVRAACGRSGVHYIRFHESDCTLKKLFKDYPRNRNFHHVLLKVAVLNSLSTTRESLTWLS